MWNDFNVKGKDLEKIESNAEDILTQLENGASKATVVNACHCLIREMNRKNRLFNAIFLSFSDDALGTRKQVETFVRKFLTGLRARRTNR